MPSNTIMSKLQCRLATAADLVEMTRVLTAVLTEGHPGRTHSLTSALIRKAFFGPQPYGEALLATMNTKVLGMLTFGCSFSHQYGGPIVNMDVVWVDPMWRKSGMSRILFREMARVAEQRGFNAVHWAADTRNPVANKLAKTMGASLVPSYGVYRVNTVVLKDSVIRGRDAGDTGSVTGYFYTPGGVAR